MLVYWASVAGLFSAPAVEHRMYYRAVLTVAASQMPVSSATEFALSRLLTFLIPRMHSELPQVLECWSHVSVCLWLILSTSFCHLTTAHSFPSTPACPGTHQPMSKHFPRVSQWWLQVFPKFCNHSFILRCRTWTRCTLLLSMGIRHLVSNWL